MRNVTRLLLVYAITIGYFIFPSSVFSPLSTHPFQKKIDITNPPSGSETHPLRQVAGASISAIFITLTPTPKLEQGSLIQKINVYRATLGLSPVRTDGNTCAFAKTRAMEIKGGFNHSGFTSRVDGHSLPYPSYHEVTENIEMNPDVTQVVTAWINSLEHAENMRRDTPFVCVQASGNYYAYEGWKP